MQTTIPKDWICLNSYSSKYSVSISTLRRRIKKRAILYKLEQGKYFIIDQKLNTFEPKLNTSNFDPNLALSSLESLINEIKSTYVTALEEKDRIIIALQKENLDLKSLVNIMESDI